MKKLLLSLCAVGFLTATYAQTVDRSIQPKPGPAPKINLKQPATFTLPNGLKVFVVENHKMPIVTYSIMLNIYPGLQGDKVGLHSFVGELLTRGTTDRSKQAFDESVDDIGASISASGSSISGVSLAKYQDSLLTLMSDALLHPAFSEKQLKKVEKQTESSLISNENDADNMLSNVSGVVNFGKNHPYGEVMTLKTVRNITVADCKQYYQTYFHPNVAYLAVVGDVTPAEAKKLVTKYFGSWQRADVPKATYPEVKMPSETTVDFVNRPGAVQSVIGITYPIHLKIGSPNVIKAAAMNQILGGGSSGRLFLNLRETHGWTYGAYSRLSADNIIGSAKVYAKCRNVVTDSSIRQMLLEMDSIRTYPVKQATLEGVKHYMSGVFALRLESPQTIAQYAITIDMFHMPKDYYTNYLKNVAKVTVADVQAMAKKYIRPDKAHIVVVGNSSQVKNLKQFAPDGKINFYDAYGNSVQPASAKVVNGKKIDDVLAMYINAMGGKKAIQSLTSLQVYANLKMHDKTVARVSTITKSPTKYLRTVRPESNTPSQLQASGGLMSAQQRQQIQQQKDAYMTKLNKAIRNNRQKIMVNGDKGYRQFGRNKRNLSGEALRPYQAEADLQSILHPEKYGISYSLISMGNVHGKPAYEVSKVSNNGKDKAVLFIDAQSGQLLKKIETEQQGGQSVLTQRYYSDYKEVKDGNGYKIPFVTKIVTAQGNRVIDVSSAKANGNIKDKKFR